MLSLDYHCYSITIIIIIVIMLKHLSLIIIIIAATVIARFKLNSFVIKAHFNYLHLTNFILVLSTQIFLD